MRARSLLCAFVFALILWGCNVSHNPAASGGTDDHVGGGSGWETKTIVGTVVFPNGEPATGGVATLRTAGHLADPSLQNRESLVEHETVVDSNGEYRFHRVPVDGYQIELRHNTGLAALVECEVVDSDTIVAAGTDTLRCPGRLTGSVVLKEIRDTITSRVYVYGMDRVVSTNGHGRFTFDDLPSGVYRLRIVPEGDREMAFDFGGIVVDTCGVTHLGNLALPEVTFVQNCSDGECDSAVVRSILDAGLRPDVAVEDVVLRDSLNGHVTTLDLQGLRLSTLAGEIGQLGHIEVLILSDNNLTGLPGELGFLTSLRSLVLDGNPLGRLMEPIDLLDSLQFLSATNCNLAAFPTVIRHLPLLSSLVLGDNVLSDIPSWICSMDSLVALDIHNNLVAQLPDCIGALSHLAVLDCRGNLLHTLPASLALAGSLHTILASDNSLTSLPDSVMLGESLQALDVSNNDLVAIPESVGSSGIRRLLVHSNRLVGLPLSIIKAVDLDLLTIQDNHICTYGTEIETYLKRMVGDFASTQICE